MNLFAHRIRQSVMTLLLISALILLAKSIWIPAKAQAAQWLIASAWKTTLETGEQTKPWQWADTWPVARLTGPDATEYYVLDSVSGQALAFGPGWLNQSAVPGENGRTIIAAHRDTHFEFLEKIRPGDHITVQNRAGQLHSYQVKSTNVVDSSQQQIELQYEYKELVLITCYPFHALNSGGPLRFVVYAEPVENTESLNKTDNQ